MRNVIPKYATLIPDEATRVFKGIIYDVYHWQQKQFDGSEKTFEMIKRPDTVVVIAIKDDKIVVTEQEQPSHQPFFDIPGGMHDKDGETEDDAIKRELLEETGMSFKNWKLIDVTQPDNKVERFIYLFLATNLISEASTKLDAGERIKTKLMSLEEIKSLANSDVKHYFPMEILNKAKGIEDLISSPEYNGSSQLQ